LGERGPVVEPTPKSLDATVTARRASTAIKGDYGTFRATYCPILFSPSA
jgi:hypothetical protein